MRNFMVFLHRWIALIFGVFVILVSITGSIIVIEGSIDRALNPGLYDVQVPASGPVRLPLDSLVASARSRGEISSLALPEADGLPAIAALTDGGELFVNPYSGGLIGSRTAAQRHASFVGLNHNAHVSLLGGWIGNKVVLWCTIGSVLLVLGGLYLWWKEKIWHVRFSASWKRINVGLHHLLGVTTFVVLFLMTFTGVILHYAIIARALAKLDRVPAPSSTPQSQPVPGTPMISLEAAARAGLAALPESELRTIYLPADTKRPITIGLRFPDEHGPGAPSRVAVDRWTGAVLSVRSTRAVGIGTRMSNLRRPLHTGDILGAPTQAIWFAASLILAVQAVTGFLMWWNGRPARTAEAARKAKARAVAA